MFDATDGRLKAMNRMGEDHPFLLGDALWLLLQNLPVLFEGQVQRERVQARAKVKEAECLGSNLMAEVAVAEIAHDELGDLVPAKDGDRREKMVQGGWRGKVQGIVFVEKEMGVTVDGLADREDTEYGGGVACAWTVDHTNWLFGDGEDMEPDHAADFCWQAEQAGPLG